MVSPHTTDRWEIAELLDAARAIPPDELPDADARAALYAAIRSGEVIGVYTPFGYARHNIELRHDLIAGDPRLSADEWAARVTASQGGAK